MGLTARELSAAWRLSRPAHFTAAANRLPQARLFPPVIVMSPREARLLFRRQAVPWKVMGNRISLSAKHPDETYILVVDMSPLIVAGEVIVSASVMVTLLLGSDPGCDLALDGTASVYQNVVTQNLVGGLPGDTYIVRITGSTSLGNSVITLADLSVLSSDSFLS